MNKGFHAFPDCICPKVNVIMQVEFELAYYNITVQHVNHYVIIIIAAAPFAPRLPTQPTEIPKENWSRVLNSLPVCLK